MPLSAEQLDTLDPSICRLPLFWEQPAHNPEALFLVHYRGQSQAAKRGFWKSVSRSKWATLREDWVPDSERIGFHVTIQFLELNLLSEERIETFKTPSNTNVEPTPVELSWAQTERLKDCAPQFTLRNLPRVSRDIELDQPLWFDLEDAVLDGAFDDIDKGRETEIPKPEWMEFWSLDYVDDFRIFLQEIKYLCPWDSMPKHQRLSQVRVEAGVNLWDTAHSRAQLSVKLLERARSGSIFAIGTAGRLTSISFGPRGGRTSTPKRKSKLADSEVTPIASSTVGLQEFRLGASAPTPVAQPEESSEDEDGNRMG